MCACQVTTLVLFAWFKWSNNVPGGTLEVLKRGLSSWSQAPVKQGRVDNYRESSVMCLRKRKKARIVLILCRTRFANRHSPRLVHLQCDWYSFREVPALSVFQLVRTSNPVSPLERFIAPRAEPGRVGYDCLCVEFISAQLSGFGRTRRGSWGLIGAGLVQELSVG